MTKVAKDLGAQYDKMGHDYAATNREFFKNEPDPAREFIRKWVGDRRGNLKLLDIGCGEGDDLVAYEAMGFNYVFGVDPSWESVKAARLKPLSSRGDVFQGHFERIPVNDGVVDIATSRFAFHYVLPENIDKGYAEVARVLKPGGLLVFAVDHPAADMAEGEQFDKDGITFVRIKLFGGTVPIEFPLHSIDEYFSPAFYQHFDLLVREEPICKDRTYQDGPNALFYAARKK